MSQLFENLLKRNDTGIVSTESETKRGLQTEGTYARNNVDINGHMKPSSTNRGMITPRVRSSFETHDLSDESNLVDNDSLAFTDVAHDEENEREGSVPDRKLKKENALLVDNISSTKVSSGDSQFGSDLVTDSFITKLIESSLIRNNKYFSSQIVKNSNFVQSDKIGAEFFQDPSSNANTLGLAASSNNYLGSYQNEAVKLNTEKHNSEVNPIQNSQNNRNAGFDNQNDLNLINRIGARHSILGGGILSDSQEFIEPFENESGIKKATLDKNNPQIKPMLAVNDSHAASDSISLRSQQVEFNSEISSNDSPLELSISIGRVEIRTSHQPDNSSTVQSSKSVSNEMNLDIYLKKRDGGNL